MNDRPERMKARLPRGFVDRGADDLRATARMVETIREVYERYGFEPVETPLVEYTDALGKFLPDQDRPNEGVFSFLDEDEQWLSLRYDLTAPLARYVAENWERLPKPYRSYRSGWVFRNEKPGPGRFRQFMQFDADTVGTPGVAADAEMAMMMADVMEALGIGRGDYVIRVNNRKVLDGILDALNLDAEGDAPRRLTVLRAIDKRDKFAADEIVKLLTTGRWDGGAEGEGDFTKGAQLPLEDARQLVDLLDSPGIDEFLDNSSRFTFKTGRYSSFSEVEKFQSGVDELRQIGRLVAAAGYGSDRIRIDPSVVRGLEYYTGPVYEAELTFPVTNEDGEVVRFGSVGGGGRYDGLVSRFRGEPVPATGFSIGVSRLMTALKNLGKLDDGRDAGPVVVLAMDRDTESLGRTQAMVSALRQAGIRSEMYLGGAGMKAQMKYADRRRAPCVVIQGADERAAGTVQIKDLVEGKRLSQGITDNEEWRASRPAQETVPESELVAAVRRVLDAQENGA
ncbi:MAG: histidine--tRNA ligase [Mesorhizobium amorphae]|nr:MAG: histidine--tRNA ligase [Mesorhizobium amorphae]